MIIMSGFMDTRTVLVDGRLLDPAPSQRLWNHSPDGFNWGYAGSGPVRPDPAGGDPHRARALHRRPCADRQPVTPRSHACWKKDR